MINTSVRRTHCIQYIVPVTLMAPYIVWEKDRFSIARFFGMTWRNFSAQTKDPSDCPMGLKMLYCVPSSNCDMHEFNMAVTNVEHSCADAPRRRATFSIAAGLLALPLIAAYWLEAGNVK
jgi:hypothetical protein